MGKYCFLFIIIVVLINLNNVYGFGESKTMCLDET